MPEEIPSSPRIEDLRERLKADPNSRMFLQLAEEYRRAGAPELAARVCRDGLEKHPNYHAARVALARSCVQLGRVKEAVSELKTVLKAAPDNILAGKLLGQIYESVGKQDRALATYQHLQPYDPGDEELLEKIQVLSSAVQGPPEAPPLAAPPVEAPPAEAPVAEAPPPTFAEDLPDAPPPVDPEPFVPAPPQDAPPEAPAPSMDEGTAILDEPPELEGGSSTRFMRPMKGVEAGEDLGSLPPEMQGEINEMSHGLQEELDQTPTDEAVPDTLDMTPSPDLLPTEIRAESGAEPGPPPEEEAPAAPAEAEVQEGVVSRTMADLLYKQGHIDQAIATMEKLVLADQATKEDEGWLGRLMGERGDRLAKRLGPSPEDMDRMRLEQYRRWLAVLQ